MKNQTLLLLILIITCIFISSGCNRERDLTRNFVVQKKLLHEGDNMIYNDGYLEVNAHFENGKISYTGKTTQDDPEELTFIDSGLKIISDTGSISLEGGVSCSCTKETDTAKWLCRSIQLRY